MDEEILGLSIFFYNLNIHGGKLASDTRGWGFRLFIWFWLRVLFSNYLVGGRRKQKWTYLQGSHASLAWVCLFLSLLLGSFWVFFFSLLFLIIPYVSIICVTWLQKDAYATFVCHFASFFEIWLPFFSSLFFTFVYIPPNLSCYFFCCVVWAEELWNAFLVARFSIQMPVLKNTYGQSTWIWCDCWWCTWGFCDIVWCWTRVNWN